MKIDASHMSFTDQATTSRGTGKADDAGTSAGAGRARDDSLSVSDAARRAAAADLGGVHPESDKARIAALKRAIESGTLITDPVRIAEKLHTSIVNMHEAVNHEKS